MELIVRGNAVDAPITEDLLTRSLDSLTGDTDSFMILAHDEMTYLQTAGGDADGFVLEHQAGALDRHFQCRNTRLGRDEVRQAFLWYLAGDTRWQSDFDWEEQPLGGSGSGVTPKTLGIAALLIAAAALLWMLLPSG